MLRNASANFFQILQGSSNFCKTQHHVLYFLIAGNSRISNMTFLCTIKVIKVMKIMRISLYICIFLHFSGFSLHQWIVIEEKSWNEFDQTDTLFVLEYLHLCLIHHQHQQNNPCLSPTNTTPLRQVAVSSLSRHSFFHRW